MTILVTGGHGFIGSNFIKLFHDRYPERILINVDSNTYASRPDYLAGHGERFNYKHINADIRDAFMMEEIFNKYKPKEVVHFAAESHVCNSIKGPRVFSETNIMGTFNLIEAFRKLNNGGRFLHVSTDEVFGELPLNAPELKFSEKSPIAPRSPYSSSKAASDHLVQGYYHTYGLKTIIVNCSNNYGPNQHEEKLIPKTIKHLLRGLPVTIHGKGDHVRDWLFVDDCCEGILRALGLGCPGERYCLGGNTEFTNLELVQLISMDLSMRIKKSLPLILHNTDDRPTDDTRYAIDTSKAEDYLKWKPRSFFRDNLEKVFDYYLEEFKYGN